jgi:hypothetical protein
MFPSVLVPRGSTASITYALVVLAELAIGQISLPSGYQQISDRDSEFDSFFGEHPYSAMVTGDRFKPAETKRVKSVAVGHWSQGTLGSISRPARLKIEHLLVDRGSFTTYVPFESS